MNFALVTGTTRGIGLAAACALLQDGWSVCGVARGDAPAALQAGGALAERYRHVRLDLSDASALEDWLRSDAVLRDALTGSDRVGLVNNAGVLSPMTLLSRATATQIAHALTINVAAPLALSGHVARVVPHSTPLRIVDLSSGAAHSAYPGWGTYCASKAALAMASRVLAAEIDSDEANSGLVRDAAILSFAPGVVATTMQEEIRASSPDDFPEVEKFRGLHEASELVLAERPARRIADWLASDPGARFEAERFSG